MIPVESQFKPGLIVVPSGMTPRFNEFFDCLQALHVPGGTGYMRLGGPDCDTNRNKALRLLPNLDVDADWVLFMDDDQAFRPETLMQMLYTLEQRQEIDALTGWYVRKKVPFRPVLYRVFEGEGRVFERLTTEEITEARKKGRLMQIGACGGGMLLARRRTIDLIGDPWFNPGPGRSWGGDLGFCGSMLKLGLKLFVDLGLPVGHAMPSVILPEWDEQEQKWYMSFAFGKQSFRVSTDHFKGCAEYVD